MVNSMKNNVGETICQYRQMRKMTQEEFASRLGVTPQAVSKWERGNGLPDVSLLEGICRVLEINANTLLGLDEKIVENGNVMAAADIKNAMFAEPLVLEFGVDVIPCIAEGLKTDYVNQKRKELIWRTGMLMPTLRLRDNALLAANSYRVLSYDRVLYEAEVETSDTEAYYKMIYTVVECCEKNYASIINKSIVKIMANNLNELFPGITEDLVPDKISYLQIERKLQSYVEQGKSIRDFVHILEEMEEELTI